MVLLSVAVITGIADSSTCQLTIPSWVKTAAAVSSPVEAGSVAVRGLLLLSFCCDSNSNLLLVSGTSLSLQLALTLSFLECRIESMNSVMDDNRLLTLPSNERIRCLPHMKLIFEIRDLKYATPATATRAGILYISEGEQWNNMVQSWIQKVVRYSYPVARCVCIAGCALFAHKCIHAQLNARQLICLIALKMLNCLVLVLCHVHHQLPSDLLCQHHYTVMLA